MQRIEKNENMDFPSIEKSLIYNINENPRKFKLKGKEILNNILTIEYHKLTGAEKLQILQLEAELQASKEKDTERKDLALIRGKKIRYFMKSKEVNYFHFKF